MTEGQAFCRDTLANLQTKIYTTDSADPYWTKQEQFLGF
jgi:hypothetical protein